MKHDHDTLLPRGAKIAGGLYATHVSCADIKRRFWESCKNFALKDDAKCLNRLEIAKENIDSRDVFAEAFNRKMRQQVRSHQQSVANLCDFFIKLHTNTVERSKKITEGLVNSFGVANSIATTNARSLSVEAMATADAAGISRGDIPGLIDYDDIYDGGMSF